MSEILEMWSIFIKNLSNKGLIVKIFRIVWWIHSSSTPYVFGNISAGSLFPFDLLLLSGFHITKWWVLWVEGQRECWLCCSHNLNQTCTMHLKLPYLTLNYHIYATGTVWYAEFANQRNVDSLGTISSESQKRWIPKGVCVSLLL